MGRTAANATARTSYYNRFTSKQIGAEYGTVGHDISLYKGQSRPMTLTQQHGLCVTKRLLDVNVNVKNVRSIVGLFQALLSLGAKDMSWHNYDT